MLKVKHVFQGTLLSATLYQEDQPAKPHPSFGSVMLMGSICEKITPINAQMKDLFAKSFLESPLSIYFHATVPPFKKILKVLTITVYVSFLLCLHHQTLESCKMLAFKSMNH